MTASTAMLVIITAGLLAAIVRMWWRIRIARQVLQAQKRRMMRDARLCVKCGYDVRACESVCSECSWPIGADP